MYIEHDPFIKMLKSTKGHRNLTLGEFILDNKLTHIIVDRDGNVVDKPLNWHHHTKRSKVLISIEAMLLSTALEPLLRHMYHMVHNNQYRKLILTDDDIIYDMYGKPAAIEMRGHCCDTGILFLINDIDKYLGIQSLLGLVTNDRNGYTKDIHWRELYVYPDGASTDIPKSNTSRQLFLTFAGLIKIMTEVPYANDDHGIHLSNWIINLSFAYKFGSLSDRIRLMESLTSLTTNNKCLTKVSGVYLACMGKVKDYPDVVTDISLPATMVDTASFYKIGYSDNIKALTRGIESTQLEWYIAVPQHLCMDAASQLEQYLTSNFKFVSGDTPDQHKLFIVNPGSAKQSIKNEYIKLGDQYLPNELDIKKMNALKDLAEQMSKLGLVASSII
jgi:hypothetical protein